MKATVTAGLAVLAGVALFEAALIPGGDWRGRRAGAQVSAKAAPRF